MKKNILVIAAHPDDEVLGCGGAISKFSKLGFEVSVLIMGEGITSRGKKHTSAKTKIELKRLLQSARNAHQILGVKNSFFESFPDNQMDSIPQLSVIKKIEAYIQKILPVQIYTHSGSDLNIDHQIIHQAVITATRPAVNHSVKQVFFFEIASSTEWQFTQSRLPFIPNWFENIGDSLSEKLKALNAYASEMREWPHPRSIQAVTHLAKWRGATAGYLAAEAFVLGRNLSD